ncbi:hypothetical protein [Pseudorhodoplanes sinuspersici]|uniref:Uncharacterized protein n=1 Tax=Pseudorhodoplanes sinuspersici TaxID=1235591 RepID=A0A1W6ZZX6_9HYPH|nr:hypothetical protein [Pseudorhodoplanes sinuspersici]ARQ02305.1 hypothetical protein CAK95_26790 [Pseudorhodoplanes sinuspersici]RKE74133.1 hypothetical protein DFP91_2034 [Pseudorhodoplanes sinuspersici]
MADLDRTTAKALVEAGYMPLSVYIQMFGATAEHEIDAPLVPDLENNQIGPLGTPSRVNHH